MIRADSPAEISRKVQGLGKTLVFGTAVGLLNPGPERQTVTAGWSDLGLTGRLAVRDLWQRRNLGTFDDTFTAEVPAHGAMLLKIGEPKPAIERSQARNDELSPKAFSDTSQGRKEVTDETEG